jgi:hypothetical protein
MAPIATVIVPTHDHGPLLELSVGSALRQAAEDIEVFIVGDGASDETRDTAHRLVAGDERVRFFDNPKGPRHGEIHRHAALEEAAGDIVCYLSDDDLWFPDHVTEMRSLLDESDFAHALPMRVEPDGSIGTWVGHLSVAASRSRVVDHHNFIPLSCGAHTLAAYRGVPHGWRTTPDGIATDVYMWAQFLADPSLTGSSGSRATVLHFSSPDRTAMTTDDRMRELETWSRRSTDATWRSDLDARILDHIIADRADREMKLIGLQRRVATANERAATAEAQLTWITETRTWRARAAMLRLPGMARLIGWVGAGRAPRGDR